MNTPVQNKAASAGQLTHLGRYRLIGELGRGAMGVVYRAEDPSLGRVVAIKAVLLTTEAAASLDYEARFYQEAKAAGSLNHHGIITIYDSGREGNWAYIAMELLEGEDLREILQRGAMPVARVLDIAAQVAEALEVAHQHGVVHRDIKPGNIMVLAGDHAKIMDFGIARVRVSEVETQVGLVLGSPRYMSPEQVSGQRVDHRSDIFSLGVLLFEMLGGMSPFSGKDMGELMYAVTNVRQPRPSQLNPKVPSMLDLIVEKALQKDMATRYQSAREMAEDLRLCRDALPDEEKTARPLGESTVPLSVDTATPADAGDATTKEATNAAATTQPLADAPPSSGGMAAKLASAAGMAASPALSATGDDATVKIGQLPIAGDVWLSRRFNSAKALRRLTQPSNADRDSLLLVPANNTRRGWLAGNAAQIALLVIAVVVAVAIAAG